MAGSTGKRIEVPVIAVTDERALRDSDQKLKKLGDSSSRSLADKLANAGTDGGKLMSQNFERSFKISPAPFAQIHNEAERTGRTAGAQLRQGIRGGVADGLSDATAIFGRFSGTADGVLQGVVAKAGTAGIAIGGIGIAAVAVGQQLYKLGTTWDDVTDGIAARTGKLGAELDGITASVERVAVGVAIPLKTVGEIAGGVAQSLHLSGRPLDAMTKQIAELTEVTGEAVDIRDLGKAFRVFGVDAASMPKALDDFYTASTNTGRSVNELVDAALKGAPALNAFGLGIGSSTGLITLLEDAGVDAEGAVGAMTIALKKFADAGLAPQQALRDTVTRIKELNDVGNQVGAIDLAQTTFGKGFAPIFEAIRGGTLDAQALSNTLSNDTGPSIGDVADSTRDAAEAFEMLKNKVAIEFAPAAKSEFEAINRLLTEMIGTLSAIAEGDWGSAFGGIWDDLTAPFTSPDAPWRKLFPNQTPPPTITNPITGLPAAQSNAPASTRDSGGVPDFTIDPRTGLPRSQSTAPAGTRDSGGLPPGMIQPAPGSPGGPPLLLPTEKKGAGSGSGQTGPVVPFAGDPMSLLQGLPVTASLYSSANSLLEAQNKAQQETAELNALLKDNTATADQINKARNELADAERQAFQAELSLNEAKKAATDKSLKGMADASAGFADIGAGLDADLGFSKGLPGLADNLVRFIASLAAAPIQGMLAPFAAQNKGGGSGILGMLGVGQGAPQQGYANYGPQPGAPYSPGSASPGESARDFAHRVMQPFFEQQGLTVGDHAADKFGEHQNGALDIMVDSIAEGNKVLQQVLSDPNAYGAIFNNQAYGYGQGPGARPYSGGNTGDPTQDHLNHVHAWYKPGGANNITPGAPAFPSVNPAMPTATPASADAWWSPQASAPGSTFPSPVTPYAQGVPAMPGGPLANGMPTAAPFAGGPGVSPASFSPSYAPGTPEEQAAPSWTPQGGGNAGVGGGLIGAAMSGAGGAMNMMMPGAGAAADMAMQMINKTIAFGGKAAGIGMQGLMETFGVSDPDGGGNSTGSSWLTRIAGGLAGARPASGMGAGQQGKNSKVDPNDPRNPQGQPGQPGQPGQGAQGGPQQTNHISIAIPPDRAGNAQQLANDMGSAMYNAHINPGG